MITRGRPGKSRCSKAARNGWASGATPPRDDTPPCAKRRARDCTAGAVETRANNSLAAMISEPCAKHPEHRKPTPRRQAPRSPPPSAIGYRLSPPVLRPPPPAPRPIGANLTRRSAPVLGRSIARRLTVRDNPRLTRYPTLLRPRKGSLPHLAGRHNLSYASRNRELLHGHALEKLTIFALLSRGHGQAGSALVSGRGRVRKRLRMGVHVKLLRLFELCCLLRPRTGALRFRFEPLSCRN
jgi:hypothetical protein